MLNLNMEKKNNHTDLLVLTTSTIVGYNICKYFNPVTSHVVAGTNVFNEFLGGLSDVFGGRSNQFQKQISSIYEQAIDELKFEACRQGANCIIGLKIDVDEISGKGKSMFMITAIGTPVLVKITDIENNLEEFKSISSVEFNNILLVDSLFDEFKEKGSVKLDVSTWQTIINNRLYYTIPFIIDSYIDTIKFKGTNAENFEDFNQKIVRLIRSLNIDDSSRVLYEYLLETKEEQVKLFLLDLIKVNHIINYNEILSLCKSKQKNRIVLGTFLTQFDPINYYYEDVFKLEELIKLIEECLTDDVKIIKKKKLLSSKEVEKWECLCGELNDLEIEFCNNCLKDKFGFIHGQFNKSKALANLLNKTKILKDKFV